MTSANSDVVISADSHVIEDPLLWQKHLPARFRDQAPVFPPRGLQAPFQAHPGGWDPTTRVDEMHEDGVSREVLYPSLAMSLFGMADPALQEACVRVYNDWLIEYCSIARESLLGIAAISTFDIQHSMSELERCKEAGLVGAMVWEVPPQELAFATGHYEGFWEVAQALEMPISLHSLTGTPYPWPRPPRTASGLVYSGRRVNQLTNEAADAISDIIGSGVLERFPRLRFVLVESGTSWIPYYLSRYDTFFGRDESHRGKPRDVSLPMAPSNYFARQFSATFFDEPTLGNMLPYWGAEVCLWSSDYPHANSTWPNSQQVIERDLGHLSEDSRYRVLAGNVSALYHLGEFDLAVH